MRNSLKVILEPRLVFDGAAVATASHTAADVIDQSKDTAAHDAPAHGAASHDDASGAAAAPAPVDAPHADPAAAAAPIPADGRAIAPPAAPVQEIVFADSRIEGLQTLLSGVPAGVAVVVLDPTRDGIEQISETLAGRTGIEAIHVLSHGSDGSVTLGGSTLNAVTLSARAEDVAGWRDAMADDADILLYGCEVAETQRGKAFADTLAVLTGADVAASDDATGGAGHGGDWILEYRTGGIEASAVISDDARAQWDGLLAAPSITAPTDPLAATEDTTLAITGISVSDADATDTLTVTVNVSNGTLAATGGTLSNGGKTLTVSGTDQDAINAVLAGLTYTPNTNSNAGDLLRVQASDGTTTTTQDLTITVAAVNDAPTLTKNTIFSPVTEDSGATGGTLVSALLDQAGYGDVDSGALRGIAIVGTTFYQGTWQYSSDGSTWNDVGSRSDSSALLLQADAGTSIRFIPGSNFNGTATLQFRAWDRTSDSAGATVDLTLPGATGGGTAFSASRQTATINVLPVNDAPTLSPYTVFIDEGAGNTVKLTTSAFGLYDPDMGGLLNSNPQYARQIMFKLTELPDPAKGVLRFGNDRLVVGSIFSLQDVIDEKITYRHTGYQTTAAGGTADSFKVTVDDGAGGTVDATRIDIAIRAVNQAPAPTMTLDGTAYEGRKNVGLTLSVADPDQTSGTWAVAFTNVQPGAGVLYRDLDGNNRYDAGEEVTEGSTYTGALSGLRLRYDVDGAEPSAIAPRFTVTVTDDGGGTTPVATLTGSTTFSISVQENNDDPVLTTFPDNGGTGLTIARTVDTQEARVIALDTSILNVTDTDSGNTNISFNILSAPDGGVGTVQVLRGGTWRNLGAGANFTLAEVIAGSVRYYVRTSADGTHADQLRFQIRDSEITAFSTVRQVVDPRDGGARDAADTAYLTFTLDLSVTVNGSPPGGEGGPIDPLTFITNLAPTGVTVVDIGTVHVEEGGVIRFTRDAAGQPQLLTTDPDTADAQLVYRLTSLPTGGAIQLYTGSGDPATDTENWRTLNIYSSFTQADVNAGKVRFSHDGGEDFLQSFSFTVSDGANVTAVQTVNIDVTPVNDTPTATTSGTAQLVERNLANLSDTSPDNGYYVFNTGGRVQITLGDVDGSGDKTGDVAHQSTDTQIGFTVVTGPAGGVLQVFRSGSWQAVVAGVTFITRAELAAGSFRYVHNGDEVFSDSFTIRPDDGRGQPNSVGADRVVNLSIARFNDPPAAQTNTGLQVVEGGTGVIGGVDGNGDPLSGSGTAFAGTGKATLLYTDPDNTTLQRQYLIIDAVDNGTLKRDGVALGRLSVFTQEDLDAGLITYEHNGGEVFTDSFSFLVSDGGGTSVLGTFSIKVLPRNEAPTIGTLPTYRILDSAAPMTFTGANTITLADGDLVSVDTAAGETDILRVTLDAQVNGTTYADGALTLGTTTGLTVVSGTNGTSGRLVVEGTLADLNAALATLSYQIGHDANAVVDLVITADDRTNGGANGGLTNENGNPLDAANNTAVKTVRLYASYTQDDPTLGGPTALTVNEDATLAFKNANGNSFALQISDADGFSVSDAAGTVTLGVQHGTLSIGAANGATVTGNGTGGLTLRGTLAQVNAALLTMTYAATADYNGTDTLSVTVAAKTGAYGLGGASDVSGTYAITVNPVNDTPTATSAGAETQVVNQTTPYVFSAATGNLISVGDGKDGGATRFQDTVTVTVSLTGDSTGVLTLIGGTTGQGSVTLTGTLAQVNAALDGMTYTPSNYDLDATVRLTVTIDDAADGGTALAGGVGAAQTASVSVDLNVSNADDAPTLTAPGAIDPVNEDTSITLTGAGKVFVLADTDDFGAGGMSVTLSVDHGTLSLVANDGATVTGGGTATLTITGTKQQVNDALDGLKFTPTADFHGTATITANASDGILPALQVTKAITVSPVNDRPAAAGSVSVGTVTEDTTPAGTDLATLLGGKYSDATDNQTTQGGDSTATPLAHVAIVGSTGYTAAQGTWQVSDGSGGWINVPTSGLSASAALVVSADRTIRFVPAADFHGTPGSLTVRLADGSATITDSASAAAGQLKDLSADGGTGTTGAWSSGSVTITATVANVNDRPTAAAATLAAVAEDTAAASITGATVASLVAGKYGDTRDNQSGIAGGTNASTPVGGIAVVGNAANAATEGTWYYDAGSGWVAIGTPADGSAILLPTSASLRFVPVADFNGTPGALTVRYADSAVTFSAGSDISATAADDTGTWSATTTIGTSVSARNDAPVLSGTAASPTVAENAGTGSGTAAVKLITAGTAGVSDIDFATASFGGGTITVSFTEATNPYRTGDVLELGSSFPASVVASVSGGNAQALVITLGASATEATIQQVLEAIQYRSTSDNPTVYGTDLDRTYRISFTDGNNNGLAGGPSSLASATTIDGTIQFTPVNDPPNAVDDTNTLTEDTASVSGNARSNDTDPDTQTSSLTVTAVTFGATGGTVGSALAGAYGSLTLNGDGTYSYALNTGNPAVQALRTSTDTLTETFTYTLSDGALTDTATITITITGVNDAPVAVADSLNAVEDGGAVSGNVLTNDTDKDSGDTKTVTQVNGAPGKVGATVAGANGYGSFVIGSNGAVTYTIDNSKPAVQALAQGQTVTDTVTYQTSDAAGGTSTATVTVTITGANDAPVAANDTGSVAEDAATAATGNVLTNDSDVDTGATRSVTAVSLGGTGGTVGEPLTAAYGSLTLNADGTWSYAIDNAKAAVQALAAGETLTETFGYTVADEHGATATATLTVTITGVNDAPVAVADTGTIAEDAATASTGNLLANDTDVDTTNTHSVTAVSFGATPGTVGSALNGAYGTLTLNSTGAWSYSIDNTKAAVQALRTSGDTLTETFTYTNRDSSGATSTSTLTITITGVNDTPVAVADTLDVNEDGAAATGAVLANDTDVDSADTKTVSQVKGSAGNVGTAVTGNSGYGSFTIAADGTVSYAVNNSLAAVQALAVGESLTDSVSYQMRDTAGAVSTATVTVTIHGVNDAPVANDDTGTISATTTAPATGTVLTNDTDVDTHDTHTVTAVSFGGAPGTVGQPLTGSYGTLTLNANGTWSYAVDTANAAVQAIADGETLSEVFTYTNADNNGGTATATLTITIRGTNADPVAVADTGSTVEDATTAATGNVLTNDTDTDTSDTHTVTAVSFGGTPGTVGQPVNGAYGSLTLSSSGAWSYSIDNANAAVQALAAGATVTETFTYTNTDSSGATSSNTLTITITGANDAPVATGDTGSIAEDAAVAATGNVLTNDTDVDTGATRSVTGIAFGGTAGTVGTALTGGYGSLTLGSTGAWSYSIDNANAAVQALAVGETLTETFTYTIADEHGATATATLVVTITGANDAPVAVADTGTIAEDAAAAATGTVLANDTDVDTSNTHTVTAVSFGGTAGTVGQPLAGGYGSLTLSGTGGWSYSLDSTLPAVQALAVGETLTETFAYTNTDSSGGTASSTLTITITGTNDAPAIGGTPKLTGAVAEDTGGTLSDSGTMAFTDVDLTDAHTVTATFASSSYGSQLGTLTAAKGADTTGTGTGGRIGWTYTVDNAAVQFLSAGQTITETYTVTVSDGHGGTDSRTVTVTITGVNDTPTVTGTPDLTAAVTEDASSPTLSRSGTWAFTDADLSDAHTVTATFSGSSRGTQLGSMTADTSGGTVRWTYTASNAAVQVLAAGETVTETYTVTLSDGKGGTIARDVTATITGTNDAPVIAASSRLSGGVVEDASSPTLRDSGTMAFTDVDLTDAHTVSATLASSTNGAPLGTLSVTKTADTTGSGAGGQVTWTYTVDNAAVQFLAAGQTVTETYTVTVSDGHGGTDTRTLVLTITGTNDAPTVTGAPPEVAGRAGQALALTVDRGRFADVDVADSLRFTATLADGSPLPSWLSFSPDSLTFAGTPPSGTAGSFVVVLRATDQPGASATLDVRFTITADPTVVTAPTTVTPGTATPTAVQTTPTAPTPVAPLLTVVTGPSPGGTGGLTTSSTATGGTITGGTVTTGAGVAPTAPLTTFVDAATLVSGSSTTTGFGAEAVVAATSLTRRGNEAGGLLSTDAVFRQTTSANVELFLSGSVGNQVMLPLQQTSFQVPPTVFRHTNPGEKLAYQAVRPDGSPLPNWIQFDAQNLTFRGTPPAGVKGNVDIVIVAKDTRGHQAAAQFRILVGQDLRTNTPVDDAQRQSGNPNRAPAPEPAAEAAPAERRADAGAAADMEVGMDVEPFAGMPAGRTSFTAQLHAAGAPGVLAEARALLDALLLAADVERDAA
ncbi:VCBS domain-containing protein [Azospirillum sp.]|uniref:VCBS domain-containing protein n=1 Tax=Azospirillum sp. TaxID=34012 RepID=UPI003D72CA08